MSHRDDHYPTPGERYVATVLTVVPQLALAAFFGICFWFFTVFTTGMEPSQLLRSKLVDAGIMAPVKVAVVPVDGGAQ